MDIFKEIEMTFLGTLVTKAPLNIRNQSPDLSNESAFKEIGRFMILVPKGSKTTQTFD